MGFGESRGVDELSKVWFRPRRYVCPKATGATNAADDTKQEERCLLINVRHYVVIFKRFRVAMVATSSHPDCSVTTHINANHVWN